VASSDTGKSPGQFFWPDGTKVNDTFWSPGQPNDFAAGMETCVLLAADLEKLWDSSCNSLSAFICQLAAQDMPCF